VTAAHEVGVDPVLLRERLAVAIEDKVFKPRMLLPEPWPFTETNMVQNCFEDREPQDVVQKRPVLTAEMTGAFGVSQRGPSDFRFFSAPKAQTATKVGSRRLE
jgi:hypothetical protein